MTLTLEAAHATGLVLALARTAAFVVASPVVGRILPRLGRMLLALAAALLIAQPVTGELTVPALIGATVSNVVVGLVLGFITGLALMLFDVAGEVLDLSSGLAASRIVDPITRTDAGVITRLFQMAAFALFLAVGGDRILLTALAHSTKAVPLASGIGASPALGDGVLASVGGLMVAGLELAAPALAAFLLAEIALALATRFAPAANIFFLGFPAKILLAFAVIAPLFALFPGTVRGAIASMLRAADGAIRSLSP